MTKRITLEEALQSSIDLKDFELPPDGTYCLDPDPVDFNEVRFI